VKAIILAAGMGTRMGPYTKDRPKCMLSFNGKTLFERQIAALQQAGIEDLVVVRGYQRQAFTLVGLTYCDNPEFATTNMVMSLLCAREHLLSAKEGCVVSYGDIIYEPRLVQALLNGKGAVRVLVDTDWIDLWKSRSAIWHEDVESLQFDATGRIFEIGTPKASLKTAMARYIGLLYFSPEGIRELIKAFDELLLAHKDSSLPWRRSRSFRQGYMTCMLQELVDRGVLVQSVPVAHGWLEFDTAEDLEQYLKLDAKGSLKRFICQN